MKTTVAQLTNRTQRATHKQESQSDSQSELYTDIQLRILIIVDIAWKSCLCISKCCAGMCQSGRKAAENPRAPRGTFLGICCRDRRFCVVERKTSKDQHKIKQQTAAQAAARAAGWLIARAPNPRAPGGLPPVKYYCNNMFVLVSFRKQEHNQLFIGTPHPAQQNTP